MSLTNTVVLVQIYMKVINRNTIPAQVLQVKSKHAYIYTDKNIRSNQHIKESFQLILAD